MIIRSADRNDIHQRVSFDGSNFHRSLHSASFKKSCVTWMGYTMGFREKTDCYWAIAGGLLFEDPHLQICWTGRGVLKESSLGGYVNLYNRLLEFGRHRLPFLKIRFIRSWIFKLTIFFRGSLILPQLQDLDKNDQTCSFRQKGSLFE